MKVALAVHRISPDPISNLRTIISMTTEAADSGADLIVFAEMALTGFILTDDPSHDLPLGQPIPGAATETLTLLARERHIWIALGLVEYEHGQLYDTAVLLTPQGTIGLKYRRISPSWHGGFADPSIYQQGSLIPVAQTPWGSCVFLICGDLFDDYIISQVRDLHPNFVLFPFARSFDSEVTDLEHWEREEQFRYAERAHMIGVTTLMVNYLADQPGLGDCFGGAMVVAPTGTILAHLPLGRSGLLMTPL
ncbi:MAG: carbon-nitrogen hydrolase family protein [Ktedonobacteraceae bacterium]|nr:carbon-nitrogen hydrolase family protein [Ktedonobacteraceae bacterium]